MTITTKRSALTQALKNIIGICDSRIAIPILGQVLIEPKDGAITLTTTNTTSTARCEIAAEVKHARAITLPARHLLSIAQNLPSENITLEVEDEKATIKAGSSVFKIMGMDYKNFPLIPDVEGATFINIPQETFAQMINTVKFAQYPDDARAPLNGINIALEKSPGKTEGPFANLNEGRLRLTACDGCALVTCITNTGGMTTDEFNATIPREIVDEIVRNLEKGNLVINIGSQCVKFEMAFDNGKKNTATPNITKTTIITKRFERQYPDIRHVIPKATTIDIKVHDDAFAAAITRTALVCDNKNNAVKFTITNNNIALQAGSSIGNATESVEVMASGAESPLEISFNPSYVSQALTALKDQEVLCGFNDEATPVLIQARTKTAGTDIHTNVVIMPVRIS